MKTLNLIAQDGTDTAFKELYTDDGKYLSTVSRRYTPVEHSTVVNLAECAVADLGIRFESKVMMAHNTRDMTYHMTMKDFGDKVAPQLVIQNTYKAGKAMKLIQGQLTMVCSNGMVCGDKQSTFTHTHVRQLDQCLFNDYIAEFLVSHQRRTSYLTTLEHTGTTKAFFEHFFGPEDASLLSATDTRKISSLWDQRKSRNVYGNRQGDSVMDFYNTVTEYYTHVSKISETGRLNRLTKVDNRIKEFAI